MSSSKEIGPIAPANNRAGRTFYYHYAWVIVSIIAAMQMVGTAMRMAFGVLIDPLTSTFGWSQGEVTAAYAITNIVTAVASPFAGYMGDRYGAKRTMAVGTALFIIGMTLTAMITQPWHLYITFGAILGVAQAMFLVPLIPSAMNWFRRHLGVGMGFIMAAWGIGPALAAPVVGLLIIEFGWKSAVWIITAVSGTIMVAMISAYRDRPADKGLLPYGALPGDPVEPVRGKIDKERIKLFAGYMRKTSAYWNTTSIHFLGCVGHAVILVYLVPLAMQEGISLIVAASLLTVLSGTSVLTRFTTPIMSEYLGAKPVMALWFFLQGISVIMLFWTHDLWVFYLFAVIFGIGYGGESGGFPILNRKYFGHAPIGSTHGTQMLGAGFGMALGGWIGGPIFDITGGYEIVLVISVAASVAGALSIVLLESTSKLLIPDWDEGQSQTNASEAPAINLILPSSGND